VTILDQAHQNSHDLRPQSALGSQKHSADGGALALGEYDQLHHFIAAGDN
jgi:hypothetical protein